MKKKVNLKKAYEKTYKLNFQGKSYRSTLPPEVIKRKAKEVGLTPDKFIERYGVKIFYNDFEDMIIRFVELEKGK